MPRVRGAEAVNGIHPVGQGGGIVPPRRPGCHASAALRCPPPGAPVYLNLLLSVCFAAPPTLAIEARVAGGPWTSGPVSAGSGQPVEVRLVGLPSYAGEARWFQVFPNLDQGYQNANQPYERHPYQWSGWGAIEYQRVELAHLRGAETGDLFDADGRSRLLPDPNDSPWHHVDMGSFWLEAEVEAGEDVLRTAGIEDTNQRGLSARVFRLSVGEGDGYLGALTTFYNVPGIFGSVVYQSANYIGVDCADVLVAAWYRFRGLRLGRNYNVAMLVNEWPRVARMVVTGGVPDHEVAWGARVRPGDLVAVRPPGGRQYQHIGALYQDVDQDGLLGPTDLVLHAGPLPLHTSPLADGAFDGDVVVLRPRTGR